MEETRLRLQAQEVSNTQIDKIVFFPIKDFQVTEEGRANGGSSNNINTAQILTMGSKS